MKRRPTKRTATIERPIAQPQRRAPNIRPGGTNFTPVSDAIMLQMNQAMSTQAPETATKLYPPGAPIKPIPGFTPQEGPRTFVYPVGYNISQLPRATEAYSFADLRAMASTYYGIQMCQQVWFDYISKLELAISPRPELVGEDEDVSQYENDIQSYQDFFAFPDKELDLKAWLRKAVKDQLEIDAVAIYMRKDKAGRPFSLDLLDGSMIKPLIDDRGRRPLPPYPAYEQYWNGIPACLLTSDDLIYIKETERTDSVYGMSRVEKILLNVNIALRKQTKDLARFTDGTMPAGFISPEMDVTWSQEEIEAYEIQVNNMFAGNDELRARLKVLPRGFSYIRTDDPDIHVDLDTHLLNVTAAMHGLTMAELAFIADVNRSSGETQENVVYRRAMGPLMARYADLFTMILRKYFRENRFICHWKGFGEHEDLLMQAQAYSTLTGAGILGLTDAGKLMKLPEDPDAPYIGRVFFSKDGPIFLDDMAQDKIRSAMVDAKLAGLQLPQQAASGESTAPTEEEKPEDEEEEEQPPTKPASPQNAERERHLDLKRWRDRALEDVKRGRAQRGFTTVHIPEHVHRYISAELDTCLSPDDVRALFKRVQSAEVAGADSVLAYNPRDRLYEPEDVEKQLATLRAQGAVYLEWDIGASASGVCPVCGQNSGQVVKVGERFKSGHRLPQVHPKCQCRVRALARMPALVGTSK